MPLEQGELSGQGLVDLAVRREQGKFLLAVAEHVPETLRSLRNEVLPVFASCEGAIDEAAHQLHRRDQLEREWALGGELFLGSRGALWRAAKWDIEGAPSIRRADSRMSAEVEHRRSADLLLALLLSDYPPPMVEGPWQGMATLRVALREWARHYWLLDSWCVTAAASTLGYWHWVGVPEPPLWWFVPILNRCETMSPEEWEFVFEFSAWSEPLRLNRWDVSSEAKRSFEARARREFKAFREVRKEAGEPTHRSLMVFEEYLASYTRRILSLGSKRGLRRVVRKRREKYEFFELEQALTGEDRHFRWAALFQCGNLSYRRIAEAAGLWKPMKVEDGAGVKIRYTREETVRRAVRTLAKRIGLTRLRPARMGRPPRSPT